MTSESRRQVASAFMNVVASMLVCIMAEAIVRIVFIIKFAQWEAFADNVSSLPLFLLNALRYDAQAAAYASLPVVVAAVVVCVRQSMYGSEARFGRAWTSIAATLLGLLGLADVHYYNNFGRHFDIVVFDFFDEEPGTLIKGIIDEAPLLAMAVGAGVVFALAWFVSGWLYRLSWRISGLLKPVVAGIVVTVVASVAMRGSLGTFTLRIEDVYVSTSPMMNDCVPSAAFMMKNAWSEKKKQFKIDSDEAILRNAGFGSEQEAVEAWTGKREDVGKTADSALVGRTSVEGDYKGYDVVLIVCESWGRKLMEYDKRYGIDLLCSMRRHLEDGLLWEDFVAATMGTIDAVEALTTGCPYQRFFTSRYRDVELPYSTARLWKDAGYSTRFVSGIEISWRNLAEVLPHQGFESVTGKFEILRENPNAEVNHTWGVYDHAMLAYLLDKLNEPRGEGEKPRFFMALTSTNHTPFEFPEDVELPDLQVPEADGAFAIDDKKVIYDYLRGYQYTSECLGQFMTALKASEAGRRTIVAITGDHNTRLVLPYGEGEDEKWKYGVPFYLYVPNAKEAWCGMTSRFGSQEDIVPTLANLTLAGRKYLATGQNLLADTLREPTFGVNVNHVIVSDEARRGEVERRVRAMEALKRLWYKRHFVGE